MKYNDSYETCEKVRVDLRVYSKSISADEIESRMRIKATRKRNKGELIKSAKTAKDRVLELSSWILSSEDHVSSKDARRHLDWLLEKLVSVESEFSALIECHDVSAHITCVWWSAFGGGGPIFWPHQLAMIGKLELEFEFEFAFYGEDP